MEPSNLKDWINIIFLFVFLIIFIYVGYHIISSIGLCEKGMSVAKG